MSTVTISQQLVSLFLNACDIADAKSAGKTASATLVRATDQIAAVEHVTQVALDAKMIEHPNAQSVRSQLSMSRAGVREAAKRNEIKLISDWQHGEGEISTSVYRRSLVTADEKRRAELKRVRKFLVKLNETDFNTLMESVARLRGSVENIAALDITPVTL